MTKLKIIISLFLFLSFSNLSIAQSNDINEFETMSSEIFSFINNLNDNIDSFFDKEKAKKTDRYLGYFQNDLRKYLTTRKRLMVYLNKNNYVINKNKTKPIVSKLKKELNKLSMRLVKITPYISSEMSSHAEYIIEKIHQAQEAQQELYLTELDKLLSGQSVDTEKLQNDGLRIYTELSNSVTLISEVRESLKEIYKN